MTRPFRRPKWADNATYSSGPYAGQNTKAPPADAANGYVPEGPAPAQEANYLLHDLSDWASSLADVDVLNWHDPTDTAFDPTPAAINIASSGRGFHWPHQNAQGEFWIIPEGSTNGKTYWIVDGSPYSVLAFSTGAAHRHGFGCYSGGRGLLVNDQSNASGPRYARSNASDPSVWTTGALPVTGTTHQAFDAITTATGRMIVIGQQSAPSFAQFAWTSDDFGGTWTQRPMSSPVGAGKVTRIAQGPGNQLVAVYDGSDVIDISDNDGNTWTSRSNIDGGSGTPLKNAHYLPGQASWILFGANGFKVCGDDIANDAFSSSAFPGYIDSVNHRDLVYVALTVLGAQALVAIHALSEASSGVIHSIRGTMRGFCKPSAQGQIVQVTAANVRRSLKAP